MTKNPSTQHSDFEQLADSLPQIIWTARPDGSLDYYNERWYEFTGFERGQVGDQGWVPLLHPDDVQPAKAAWSHSISLGEDFRLELRFYDRSQDRYTWFLGTARPSRNDAGQISKWFGSCTDIDTQKKAEQQVVDILEGMNDSFFSIDADWNLSRINSKMEATTHIRRKDAIGKNFFLSFPMKEDSKYWINHHKIMNERTRVQYEEYYEPLDLWTEARGYPTADGGIAYLFRDITTEKKALQRLEELTLELQEAVRIRDEFLSIASHELRTPMTSMKLQLQMLRKQLASKKGPPPVEKMLQMLDRSNLQINRLSRLIEGLLDVTQINAGKLAYEFVETNLSECVRDAVERFSEDFLNVKDAIEVKLQPEVLLICDALRIEQVIVNLLSNAVKYGEGSRIQVSLTSSEDEILLSLQDRGIGIPIDKIEQIFQRFERLVPHTSISGMGLGLYVTKQIVEAHGGKILVESEVGAGSRFTLSFRTAPR